LREAKSIEIETVAVRTITPDMVEEMRCLRAAGMSYRAIGRQMGLSSNAVLYHLNLDYAERSRKYSTSEGVRAAKRARRKTNIKHNRERERRWRQKNSIRICENKRNEYYRKKAENPNIWRQKKWKQQGILSAIWFDRFLKWPEFLAKGLCTSIRSV
jgi:hypothetical protein